MPLHDVSQAQPGPHYYLGYNVVGGTTDGIGANAAKLIRKQIVVAVPSILLAIDIYQSQNNTNVSSLYAGLMDDNAGSPGKIIGLGNWPGENSASQNIQLNLATSATARWVSIPIGMFLSAGTYWLNANAGGNGNASAQTLYYDAGGSDQTATNNVSWFAEQTATTNSSRTYSIRASLLQVQQ